ncbi:hypothetical protein IQ5_00484 [Streptococcus thermophilus MTCC 5460]|nr:hypothetical protein IQ7_00489 [Streptococcus thermophilus MTCC 5461]ELW76347.1 hypothetical protein IQ5_00484 [Streptococcus thermophilus MTCC 5460]
MQDQLTSYKQQVKPVTQAARKIAESIADLDTIGKQTLAAARVVLFLLVLYLAEITFI